MKLITVVLILWLSILTFVIVKDKYDMKHQEVANVVRPAIR